MEIGKNVKSKSWLQNLKNIKLERKFAIFQSTLLVAAWCLKLLGQYLLLWPLLSIEANDKVLVDDRKEELSNWQKYLLL